MIKPFYDQFTSHNITKILSILLQEDLTPETTTTIINALKRGERPPPGPQSTTRYAAEPAPALTSLTSPPPGPGFGVRSDL